ncbi:MAG: nucleotide triphosphate diphosphatase NUDT15 [Candidatus Woesearchaeota archaeon]
MVNNMNAPRVGVGVMIVNDNKVLLGKRKNSLGDGTWAFPGGKLDYNESIEDCAVREVLEETGLSIKNIRQGPYTNDIFVKEGIHYITVFVIADYDSGKPSVMEPNKCEGWEWFLWDDMPLPLFLPLQNLLEQGFNPFNYR